MRVKYGIAFLMVSMVVLSGLGMPSDIQAEGLEDYILTQSSVLLSNQDNIPSKQSEGWQDVRLPHNWSDVLPNHGGAGWYQLQREATVRQDEPWAVYLPLLNMNAAVYINGQLIGSGGSFTEPVARHWNTPLYFLVPSSVLKTHHNIILVYLKGYVNAGTGLGVVYFGPERILKAAFETRFAQRYTFPLISFFFTLLLCAISIFIWLFRRSQSMYGWFALATLMYSLFLANHFVQNIPVSRYVWEWALHSSTEWSAFCLLMFTHRFFQIKRVRFEQFVGVTFLSTSLLLFFLPNERNMFFFFNLTHTLSLLVAFYIAQMFVMQTLHKKQHTPLLIMMSILLCGVALFAAHDLSMGLTPNLHNASFILSLSAPVLPVVLGWMLVYRFVRLQNQAETFAQELKREVNQTKHDLQQEFNIKRSLEKEQLISHERERMMQDLHDELGGQLVSACALANQNADADPDLKQMLNRALLDLRVVIDSLDEDRNLSTLLGMLRARLEPQLRAQHIKMIWKLHDGSELDYFDQTAALNILRIVQEAITNAVRHSKCTEIILSIHAYDGVVVVEVQDNGRGLKDVKEGRGTTNMRKRAKRIHAELTVESSTQGVRISIRIPIQNYIPKGENEV